MRRDIVPTQSEAPEPVPSDRGRPQERTSELPSLDFALGALQEDPETHQAFSAVRAAVERNPGPATNRLLRLAREAHESRGEYLAASFLIELQTQLADGDPDAEGALLKELGRIRREELLDDPGALDAYRKALERRPGDEEVAEEIEQIEETSKRWKEIGRRFAQEGRQAKDASLKASLLVRAALLAWQHRKRGKDKEVDKLFDEARRADPSDPRVVRLYAETLRQREQWNRMATLLAEAAEGARERQHRLNFYTRAARIFARRIDDKERAAACYERVLDFATNHEEALGYLVAFFTEREQWDHLVALYEDALRWRQKIESEQGILLQIGMVHWRIRERPDEAEPYFARLRKLDPSNPGMLDFYRSHYATTEDRASLIGVLGEALRVTSDTGQKLRLATELARVAQQEPQTAERAIDAWKVVERIDPTNREAVEALQHLYRQTEKWNALVETIRHEIDSLGPNEQARQVELWRELVPIYRDRLQLDVMVINAYNAILEAKPDDEDALEALAATYEGMGRWNDLIAVVNRQADAAKSDDRKVQLLFRVAQLWIERFANYNQATKPLEQIVAIDPEHGRALAELRSIYTKKRSWEALAGVLRRTAEIADNRADRHAQLAELAELLAERLHRPSEAIALWKQIAEEDPEATGALAAIERIAERAGDWITQAELLERRIAEATNKKARLKLLHRLGALCTDRDPSKAAEAWRHILEIDPQNGRALRSLREAHFAAGDWDALERLYRGANDLEGLVEALGGAADRATDAALKVQLSFRAASIYENELGEPARAFRSYERVLTVDPQNLQALEALAAIYEKTEKWARLAQVLATWLDSGAAEPLRIVRRLRTLHLDRLGEPIRAFELASRAYTLAPTDKDVIAELEATAAASGQYGALRDLYEARCQDANAGEQIALQRRIAVISGEQLGAPDAAAAALEAILASAPGDREAIDALDRLYRAGEHTEKLRGLLLHRLSQAQGDPERADVLRELARIEEESLGDSTSAIAHYRQLVEYLPDDHEGLEALDRLLSETEDWAQLALVVERRRETASTDQEKNRLGVRWAELLRDRLSQPDMALHVYADVLDSAPGDAEAIAGLEKIAANTPELALDAGRVLESAYESKGHWEKLVEILRARLGAVQDADERRELQLRIAETLSESGRDAEGAYVSLEAAFLDRPSDLDLRERLWRAAERAGAFERLAQAFATALEAGDLPQGDIPDLARRTAELFRAILDRPSEAERFYGKVLEHEPLDDEAFLCLKEMYSSQERWQPLQALYRSRIAETVDDDSKLELLSQLCFLFEEILDDTESAIAGYREMLELGPTQATPRQALERLLRRSSRWRELSEHLTEDLDRAQGQDAVDIMLDLATLHETQLEEPSVAVEYYQRVLERAPTHLRSQEALERLIATPALKQTIANILEPLYTAQGAWSELTQILEVQLEAIAEPDARATVLVRMAQIAEQKLRSDNAAFEAWVRAVAAEPSNAEAREDLQRLARSTGRHVERAKVLAEAADALTDSVGLRCEILLELGQLWTVEQPNLDEAERVYRQVLGLEGGEREQHLMAVRALEQIHEERGDYEALAEDLKRREPLESDPHDRASVLGRLGALLERKLEETSSAIEAQKRRLELDPESTEALGALERLYERTEGWPELADALRLHSELALGEDQRELLMRLGAVYETRLHDAPNAVAVFSDALSRFGPDRELLEALDRLYQGEQQWPELLDVLRLRTEQADDQSSKQSFLCRIAEVLRVQLGDTARALDVYEELLEMGPYEQAFPALEVLLEHEEKPLRLRAAHLLKPHYASGAAPAEALLRVLETQASSDDLFERLESRRQAAQIAEEQLDSPQRAFEITRQLLPDALESGSFLEALAEYRRLATTMGAWRPFVDGLTDVVSAIADEDLQAKIRLEMARAAEVEIQDNELAEQHYDAVLALQPEHSGALDALERLHERSGNQAALRGILQRKTELTALPKRRAELLLRQAEISTQLNEPGDAIAAYEQVLGEGARPEPYARLPGLYAQQQRWMDLASLYEQQLERGIGDQTEVHHQLGKLYVDQLSDPAQALEHFRKVLTARPEHEPTIIVMETLMRDPDHRATAAELLEPVFLRRMEWPKVSAALEARIEIENDLDARKNLLRRLAQLHEDYLEDLDGALEAYARLLREDPADSELWDTLQRVAKALEKWDRLASVFGEALEAMNADEEVSARLALVAAQVHEEKTGDTAAAIGLYLKVLEFEPASRPAFDALERLYRSTGANEELLQLCRDRVDIEEAPTEQIALMHKVADLEEKAEHFSAAIEGYRAILDIDPNDERAVLGLDRLLEAEGRWNELSDHLRWRIDRADEAEQTQLRFRLASALCSHLDATTEAIDLYEEIIQRTPTHEASITALERLVQEPTHRLRITQILEPIYRQADQWKKLIAIYEAQLELLEDPDEALRLLAEVARLHELRGRSGELAFDAWARALVRDPSNDAVFAQLDRLTNVLGTWASLIDVLERAIERSDDPQTVRGLLLHIARIHDDRLGDPRAAIEVYERMLRNDPADGDPLDALEALHTMLADWNGLVDVLGRKAERCFDPGERAELLRRAGSVLEELIGNARGAIDAYRRALEEEPDQDDTLASLERLHSNAQEWSEVVELLRRRLEVAEQPQDRIVLALRLGHVLEAQIGNPEEAIEAYRRACDDDERQPEAIERLAVLLDRQARWPELLEVLRVRASLATDRLEQAGFLFRAGQVLERELGDLPEAIETYRAALAADPENRSASDALLRLSIQDEPQEDAILALEPLLSEQQRWRELTQLLHAKARSRLDPNDQQEAFRELAQVYETHLDDPKQAFDALASAFAVDSSDLDTLADSLERLSETLNTWERWANLLAERASSPLEPAAAGRLYRRLAALAESRLGDDARAIEAYRRALENAEDERAVLDDLARLYEKTQAVSDLAQILERQLDLAETAQERLAVLLRLGELRRSALDDPHGALECYRSLLGEQPAHAEATEAVQALLTRPELALDAAALLEDVYRQTGALNRIPDLWAARIRFADSDGEKIDQLRELSAFLESELHDLPRAHVALQEAFSLDPKDLVLLDEVERLAGETGRWEQMRGVIESAIGKGTLDATDRCALALRAAQMYRDQLNDLEAADAQLRVALEARPDCSEASAVRVQVAEQRGDEREAVSILRQWAKNESDEFVAKERLHSAARKARTLLDDAELAALCYEDVLALDAVDSVALQALMGLRLADERWSDAVALLERLIEGELDASRRRSLRQQMADLYETRLGDAVRAIEVYEAVLEEDPSDLRTSDRLEALLTQKEDWSRLRDLLEQRLDQARTTEEQIAARVRLARLAEQSLGQRDEAISQLQEILELDPESQEALEELVRILERAERWEELASFIQDRVELAARKKDTWTEEQEWLERLASLREQLGERAEAIEVLERIRAHKPDHPRTLQALARLYEEEARWEDAIATLEVLAENANGDATSLLDHAASIADEHFGDPLRAQTLLRRALEHSPEEQSIRERLRNLYERTDQHERLVELLEEDAVRTEEVEHRIETFKRIADLCNTHLGDPGRAAQALERAVELAPEDRPSLLALCDLYLASGRQVDAIVALEQVVASFGNRRVKELAEYHHRLGQAHELLDQTEKALEHYDAAFKIDLTNVRILRDLGRLCHRTGDLERAQKSFRALLLQRLDAKSGIQKADVYFYLGDISAKQGDTTKATSMLERALNENPNHQAAADLLARLK